MTTILQRRIRLVLLLLVTLTVCITAHAQDSKDFKGPPPSQDAFSWTGPYLGGNGGFNFSHYDMDPTLVEFADSQGFHYEYPVPGLSKTKESFIGGGQIGYNYQLGHLVLGLEGDFDGTSSNKVSVAVLDLLNPPPPDGVRVEQSAELDWNASARLRAGFALGHFLLYGTGGGAFAHLDVHAKDKLSNEFTHSFSSIDTSSDNTMVGWTAGGGAEWAVTKWISVGLEYRHSDLGRDTYHFATTPDIRPLATKVALDENQVTLRVNVLIGGLIGH